MIWGLDGRKCDHKGMEEFGMPNFDEDGFCTSCSSWRGSLGLEPTPELYIQHIVEIFREVKRVLRKDGTVWLNLGDSYAGGGRAGKNGIQKWGGIESSNQNRKYGMPSGKIEGLKPKDLCEIPSDVVRALRADGWWLRSRMPWVKRSAMPDSAEDRPASALEYVFLLTKSQKYYFDMDAVRKESIDGYRINPNKNPRTGRKAQSSGAWRGCGDLKEPVERNVNFTDTSYDKNYKRNFRNTDLFYQSIQPPHGMIFAGDEPVGLDVNPYPMKEAHFATFPPKLVEPCILAGTSEKGCCPECGAPWERVVEKTGGTIGQSWHNHKKDDIRGQRLDNEEQHRKMEDGTYKVKTIGWKPTCNCPGLDGDHPGSDCADMDNWPVIPCTVLDIFGGSMTVAIVSHKHGRRFIMIELSETYIKDIGISRIEKETAQMKMF